MAKPGRPRRRPSGGRLCDAAVSVGGRQLRARALSGGRQMRRACPGILSLRRRRTRAGADRRPHAGARRAVDGSPACDGRARRAADRDHHCGALRPGVMEVQLARLCAHPEGRRRIDSDALPDGDRHGARRMRDREHQYRSVREDDRDRIPRRGPGRSICAWSRHATGRLPTDCDVTLGRLPGPSPARARRTNRARGALEISDRAASPRSLQREYGTLRVRASDDPAAARHFKRTVQDSGRRRP